MNKITLALAVAFALVGCNKTPKPEAASPSTPSAAATAPAPAPAPTPAPAPAEAPAAAAAPAASTTTASAGGGGGDGKAVFSQTCVACHGAGVAGAPKVGDKADWGPRIAQGKDTLYTHALQGFTGKKGMMPPKGGNASLSDADVKSAVDYMVSQAQ